MWVIINGNGFNLIMRWLRDWWEFDGVVILASQCFAKYLIICPTNRVRNYPKILLFSWYHSESGHSFGVLPEYRILSLFPTLGTVNLACHFDNWARIILLPFFDNTGLSSWCSLLTSATTLLASLPSISLLMAPSYVVVLLSFITMLWSLVSPMFSFGEFGYVWNWWLDMIDSWLVAFWRAASLLVGIFFSSGHLLVVPCVGLSD